ncbi:hypothetical protein BH23GEM5_BH23GEM5_05920 [soil metagenome]
MVSRRRWSLWVAAVVLLGGCRESQGAATRAGAEEPATDTAGIEYGITATENIRVVPVEIELADLPRGWDGMRVATISDFQLGLWPQNAEVAAAAVQRAIALQPDLIVLLGDYLARGNDFGALERVIAPLRGRPVFAVLGNEDQLDDPEGTQVDSAQLRLVEILRANGIVYLRNERARFVRGGDTAFVAGLEPYFSRRPPWRQSQILASIPTGGGTPLLLSHMPAAVAGLQQLVPCRYPLVIAGHSLCGLVEAPGTPRLVWLNTEVLPGAESPATDRLRRIGGTTLFVTCGVGHSYLPARFGGAPEVALLTLRRTGGTQPGDTVRGLDADSLANVYIQRIDSTRQARERQQPGTDTAGGT